VGVSVSLECECECVCVSVSVSVSVSGKIVFRAFALLRVCATSQAWQNSTLFVR